MHTSFGRVKEVQLDSGCFWGTVLGGNRDAQFKGLPALWGVS